MYETTCLACNGTGDNSLGQVGLLGTKPCHTCKGKKVVRINDENNKPQTFASLKEVQRHYFPNQILPRLEEALCSELGLTKPHQHRLKTENLETGLIEINKPDYSLKSIKDIAKTIGLFYKEEGYHTKVNRNSVDITKKGEKYPGYYAQILENDKCFMIWVYKSQLKLLDAY
ncbi:MAG: hypothetical protein PHH54_00185 [Candidatus Nanoarchaeia archaeon]|nr:hypothetical protein [Candidatus Nanoarchaeia archaeon]MDD5740380.1 hypothetical protein [Candidatus Nanoarchaeia archaeon]